MRTETLVLKADGHSLTILRAPEPLNRYERGIAELLRRVVVLEDTVVSWRELREYALENFHLFIDPRLDQPEEDGMDRRYEGPGAEIVTGQQAGARR